MTADSDPIAACPGTVAEPTATRGNLCLYLLYEAAGTSSLIVLDPTSVELRGINFNLGTDTELVFLDGRTSRYGFSVSAPDSTNVSQSWGSWAVRG